MGMAAVQCAIRKGLIQQGYTALNETLISYACELFGVRANRYDEREAVRQTIKVVDLKYEQGNYLSGMELLQRQARWLTRYENSSIRNFEDTAMEILRSLPDDVFSLAKLIGDDRNSLNHFGFQKSNQAIAYNTLNGRLSTRYTQMEKIITDNPDIDTTQFQKL